MESALTGGGGAPCTQRDSSMCPPKPCVSHDSLRRDGWGGGSTEASIAKMRKGRPRVWRDLPRFTQLVQGQRCPPLRSSVQCRPWSELQLLQLIPPSPHRASLPTYPSSSLSAEFWSLMVTDYRYPPEVGRACCCLPGS